MNEAIYSNQVMSAEQACKPQGLQCLDRNPTVGENIDSKICR